MLFCWVSFGGIRMLHGYPLKSSFLHISLLLWVLVCTQACQEYELPRSVVLDWFKQRVLDGLGLEEPPIPVVQQPVADQVGAAHRTVTSRVGRAAWAERRQLHHETSQVILFPSLDSTCAHKSISLSEGTTSHFTYYFQPSIHSHESIITSGHFWFYSGDEVQPSNISATLFILTSQQQLIRAAEGPERWGADGWTTYRVDQHILSSMAEGPFMLQVRCPTCQCHNDEDKMPFLHLHTRSRGPDRSRRSSVPWSPSTLDRLQRPSQDKTDYNDCHHEELNISFQELGWDNWIVHPKVFTFHYCHGNCSSHDRITTVMGIKQCCAPVPGTMKSLRFRTTSDGGYSFKYETLPNIIAEECTCI